MSKEDKPLNAFSQTLAGAVEKAGPSIVLVHGRRRIPSSGIAYQGDLVLTADHTVEREDDITILLPDGTKLPAEVAGRDPSSDLALLRLSENALKVAEVVQYDVRVGELVLALGRPSPHGVEASLGVVSAINGPVRTHRGGMIEKFIRTDAVPLPGFSGGPLVDAGGLIIGINTSGLAHGMLLTLPASVSWESARNLAEHGSVKRGFLGIRSQNVEIPEAGREVLDREQSAGLLVVHIEAESPSAEGGLMVGDIIVAISGNPVSDHDELAGQLVGDMVGQTVPVEVLRGGVLQTIEVTISERPIRHRRGKRGVHGRHSRHHGHR
jgi:S1-C subfamily serine protease